MLGRRLLTGAAIAAILAAAVGSDLMAALPKDRTIAFTNIHTKETISVAYMRGGKHIPEALEKINWVLRDWRKDEPAKMDTDLIDLLWEMHAELGSAEPIHIISGYRSRATNDMLRKTVGGQASESRHILGKAADVYFPDVPLKRLRYSALIRERGGVGYYPTSATPFIHVDTDRVRAWPRLPRFELALLFPSGKTQHQPADGQPITPEDAQVARARYQSLATQVAEYLGTRRDPGAAVAVAEASKPKPDSAAQPKVATVTPPAALATVATVEPRLVDRPSKLDVRPSETDRAKLTQLVALATEPDAKPELVRAPQPALRPSRTATALPASLTGGPGPAIAVAPAPQPSKPEARVAAVDPKAVKGPAATLNDSAGRMGWGTGWAQAPAFDEEHPEELSYRPFPLAPYMTATASPDDPALAIMTHPDVSKTLELLDAAGTMPPMKLRPGQPVAKLLWAQQFSGNAIAADRLVHDGVDDGQVGIAGRKVKTAAGAR